MFSRRHWIPPLALVYAQAAHGFSWLLLLWIAWGGNLDAPLYAFAWIHSVSLGWVTMAALAILTHALPNFVDTPWRGQAMARWAIAGYGIGVALMVAGFLGEPTLLSSGGALVLAALLVYLTTAFATLAAAMHGDPLQRAVARAFGGTLSFLLVAALLGFGLAWMLSGRAVPNFVRATPAAHADLAALGWLSLLIFGVSMRTLRPITGTATNFRFLHIVVGSLAVLGVPLLALGEAFALPPVAWIGAALFGAAALCYAFDTIDRIRRASNPHRAPQAFVVAGVVWLLGSLALGGCVLAGKPWQQAYGFVLLMGWIGQFVNAHVYHIGIRLIATIYRGDEDETPPQELLEARLSWFSFAAFQIAIGAIAFGLIAGSPSLVARACLFGITGWVAMVANIFAARLRANVRPKTIVLR